MKFLYNHIYYLLICLCTTKAMEYIYPVGSLNNGTIILYIHQRSATSIELYQWNIVTDHKEKALWSLFNPAGLQLLPNNTGFSFIDNGRLRIKLFEKRMPKAIDFDEPLYNINSLHWIDEQLCYCSAQQDDHFSIFQLHSNGLVKQLVASKNKDCMYPQKIDNKLFYIERQHRDNTFNFYHYYIMQTEYPSDSDRDDLSCPCTIINLQYEPIIFLAMKSEDEGFVIEHPYATNNNDSTITFYYCHITKKDDIWKKNMLFPFKVPVYLVAYDHEQRLFESILPLIPKVVGDKIYFADCSRNENENLELYCYSILTEDNQKIAVPKKNGHYFVPIKCGQRFCCGGTNLATGENPFVFF